INVKQIKSLNIPYIGDEKNLGQKLQDYKIDEIILVNSDFSQNELLQIFEYSRIYGVNYKYIANFFDISKNNTETSFLNKFPIVEIKSIGLNPWGRVIKRTLDLLISIFAIVILIIPVIIIAILIKLEDPSGPVIFKNRRVGKNGKLFNVYKLRYIKWEFCVKDAYGIDPNKDKALKLEQKLIKESNSRIGPLYKIKNDPRKMKIGSFIERFSIDELPQLFNVLTGDMSLIGPRPHQPREVELYKEYQKRVLTIKPGITGMGQVHGRHQNTFDDEVKLDTFYIENWSLLLDLKIFFKTIKTIINR
ncbi:sugar transferase, partial [Candidatus Gracilibacteria bacterium]|nr:sugar transferase [Candidatus Gracilibacteria bacterium]